MTDDPAVAAIESLLRVVEGMESLQREFLEALKLQRRRLDELADTLDDVQAEVIRLERETSFLRNMKAATLTMTCRRCGNVYAKEPGAELCGPCWLLAGRPGTVGLYVVRDHDPAKETTDEPA